MTVSEIIALGSLIVAAICAVSGRLRRDKDSAARDQEIVDKLDVQNEMVREIKTSVDKLDGKIDDHSVRIARLEGEVDNAYRRIDRLEGRCERHFGPSLHDKD
jgi:septal ring factor EnvC (AmiA/AmiB activator)